MTNRIQPNTFKYYFREYNGTNYDYYSIDNTGTVDITASSTPINPLKTAPKAWDEEVVKFDRGLKDWAIFRKWGEISEFVSDAATILRYKYFNEGVQASLELYVERFNIDETVWDYEEYFAVDVDFSQFKKATDSVNVKMSDNGFNEKMVSRTESSYEIEVENNPDVIWVKMHGINLQFRQKWITIDGEDVNSIPTHVPLNGEGTNLNLEIFTEDTLGSNVLLIDNSSSVNQLIELTYNYNYNIFIPGTTSSSGAPFQFHLFYEVVAIATPGTLISQHTIFQSPTFLNPSQSATYTGSNTQSINLLAGQRIFVVLKMNNTSGPAGTLSDGSYDATQLGSELLMTLDNKVPEGYIPALRPTTIYEKLIENINDGGGTTCNSTLLADHDDKVFTSGDGLRNLPNSIMKISWSIFYDSLDSILGTSFSYDKPNNECNLGYFEDAFDNTDIIDFGEVTDFEVEPMVELMFGKLKSGYNNHTYDEVNGKDEFNNETEWLTEITKVVADKDMKAKGRTDMYGIELTRLNLSGKEITDSDTDNDVFMLHIESSSAGTIPAGFPGEGEPYFELYRDPALTISNIYSPDTAFNIFFSPKRCLLRKGNLLSSIFAGTTLIKFLTNSKSNYTATKMVTDDGTTIIDEGADIVIADLDAPLFLPHAFNFKAKVPPNLYAVMQSNPFGKASFKHRGEVFKGWILTAPLEVTYNSPQQFRLLSTTDNDLTKLIY